MARKNHQALRFRWDLEIKRLAAAGEMDRLDDLLQFMRTHVEQIGVFDRQWTGIVNGASSRGIAFELSKADALDLYRRQGGRCALSGFPISFAEASFSPGRRINGTASLDRIRSELGYTLTNVWWVHRDINRMKWELSPERFLEICRAVVSHAERPLLPPLPDAPLPAGVCSQDLTLMSVSTTEDAALLVSEFLRRCALNDPGHSEKATDLWDCFNDWRVLSDKPGCSRTAFGRALGALGYRSSRGHLVRWLGLRLLPCEGRDTEIRPRKDRRGEISDTLQ